jgi:hypothetical protein
MFARMREEIDSNMNRNKEDRIVINGICCKSPLPTDSKQKIMKLREIAMTIFEFLKPGYPCKIVFANPGYLEGNKESGRRQHPCSGKEITSNIIK